MLLPTEPSAVAPGSDLPGAPWNDIDPALPRSVLLTPRKKPEAYTYSTRSPYCGTCTFQPNFSLICPAIAFAASGSPCVRNVVRGTLPSIPSNQRNVSL